MSRSTRSHLFFHHCTFCSMAFVDPYSSSNTGQLFQADGCSCSLAHRKAQAHYGSVHDGEQILFAPELSELSGQVCDECLDALLSMGLAQVCARDAFFDLSPSNTSGSSADFVEPDWATLRDPHRSTRFLESLARQTSSVPNMHAAAVQASRR